MSSNQLFNSLNCPHRNFLMLVAVVMMMGGALTKATAQSSHREKRAKVDSMLTARYYKTPYDTNYVVRPEGKLTLKLRMNQTGNSFHAKGTIHDIYSKADLHTSHKTTFAVVGIYRGIGIGIAINPAKWCGVYKDYEFNLNYYSSRISLDASYQRSESLTGDIIRGDKEYYMGANTVSMKVVNLAGYYTFNHRHFSYPAAFTQSYIQRRSAGSWLAGISYQGGSIKTTDELKERNEQAPEVRLYVGHFGIGGGYGYNWVFSKKWLFHFSFLPTFVVYNRNNMTVNGERRKSDHVRFNMIFNGRLSLVHHFTPRYFAGITFVMNSSVFDDSNIIINQNKWRARAFFGLRLGH